MTSYTLTEAAQQTGASRSAIHRAIKAGRLSATKLEDGTLRIDGAELARVYPPQAAPAGPSPWDAARRIEPPPSPDTPRDPSRADPSRDALELTRLRAEVEGLRAQLAREVELHAATREDAQGVIMDLRRRLDGAREDVRALLPPPPPVEAPPPPSASNLAPFGEGAVPSPPVSSAPVPSHPRSRARDVSGRLKDALRALTR